MNYEPVYEVVLNDGDYYFKIIKAAEGTTKTGKPNLKLTVNVWDDAGNKNTIYWQTLLEFSGNIRKLAIAVGEIEKYESKELEAYHLEGKTGKCLVISKEDALYEKHNEIKTFYAKKEEVKSFNSSEIIDDEVPF